MSYYKLNDNIFHYTEKFKKMIESQSTIEPIHTEEYSWENYRYQSDRIRMAHVERYSHDGLEVAHIVAIPRKTYKAPIFGFDVVGFEMPDKGISKINAVFIDWSPIMYDQRWHNTNWNKKRKLPVWASIFSEDFIAIRPTEDEYEKVFEFGINSFQYWLNDLNTDKDYTQNLNEIQEIIKNQNIYCEHQASNKRTRTALSANVGKETAEYFMKEILFPKIKY